MMMPANPKQSLLESLPTELLEQIFLECLNVNLPLVSLQLGTALSSTRTKMAVVLKVFPSNASFNIEHYVELSRMIWAGGASDTETAIGQLQSRVLACRWMTWDFLRLCMETFVVRTLVREFRVQNLPWQEGLPVEEQPYDAPKLPWHGGTPVKESVVRDFVHDVFALKVHLGIRYEWELDDCEDTDEEKQCRGKSLKEFMERRAYLKANGEEEEESEESEPEDTDDDENLDRGYQCLGVKTWEWSEDKFWGNIEDVTITPSLRTYSWGPADGTPRISIGIGPRNGLVILGTRLECETDSTMIQVSSPRWRCLWCQFETNIPVKLLHGPWTQDQLSFLQALVEGGAAIDLENETHKEIAKKGLTEAISDDDYGAVDLLVTRAMESQYSQCHKDNYFEPSFVEARFVMDAYDGSRDWVESPQERRTLGVKPDTEHLKVAVIERECRRKIVSRLLWARFSDIDRADPAVVDWAEKRKEEGDRNGQWLLDQLTRSGDRDREERRYWERSSSYDFSVFSHGSSETRSDYQSGDGDENELQNDNESNSDSPSVSDYQSGDGDELEPQDDNKSDIGSSSVSDYQSEDGDDLEPQDGSESNSDSPSVSDYQSGDGDELEPQDDNKSDIGSSSVSDYQSEDGDDLEPQDGSESNSDSPSVSDYQSGDGDELEPQDDNKSDIGSSSVSDYQSEDGDDLEPQDGSESNSDSPSVSDAQSENGD